MDITIDITLNNVKITVGQVRYGLASSLEIKLDNTTDIIMALTDNKMFAFVSAISLNYMWFLNAVL